MRNDKSTLLVESAGANGDDGVVDTKREFHRSTRGTFAVLQLED